MRCFQDRSNRKACFRKYLDQRQPLFRNFACIAALVFERNLNDITRKRKSHWALPKNFEGLRAKSTALPKTGSAYGTIAGTLAGLRLKRVVRNRNKVMIYVHKKGDMNRPRQAITRMV